MNSKFKNLTDSQLAELLKQGDQLAFEEFFHRYYKKILSYASKFLSSEEAQEIAQEVFVSLWEHRDQIDSDKSISNYLFRISKNKILNHLRFFARQIDLHKQIGYSSPVSGAPADEKLSMDEFVEITDKAINSLPAQCKIIFLKSRDEEKTYQQIADEMGISKDTVRLQIIKSLKSIKTYLAARFENSPTANLS